MSAKITGTVTTRQGSAMRRLFAVAWLFCLIFYFLQYAVRSAPSVMMDELTSAFGLTTVGLGSLLGLYYYTYSTCSLVSGALLDRWGGKYSIPAGTMILALGIALFGAGVNWMASARRRGSFRVCWRCLSCFTRISEKISCNGNWGYSVYGNAGGRDGAVNCCVAHSWHPDVAFFLA